MGQKCDIIIVQEENMKSFYVRYNPMLHLVQIQENYKVSCYFIRQHNEDKTMDLLAQAEQDLTTLTNKQEQVNYIKKFRATLESYCGKDA